MQLSSHLKQTYAACHDVCNLLFQIIWRLTGKLLMNGNQLLPGSLKIKSKRLAVNLHILSCSKLVKTRKKHWFGLFNNDATHYKICMFS